MSRMICIALLLVAALIPAAACRRVGQTAQSSSSVRSRRASTPISSPVVKAVVEAAIEQLDYTRYYDPSYVKLDYPGGDVPLDRGACTDVIIRAFRQGRVDLQQKVHEDMALNFSAYPQKWGLSRPDANIDHRRVPNLMVYFKRGGKSLTISDNPKDYLPGDVVAWDLGGNTTHTGLVTNIISETTGNHLIVHNIGSGVRAEDVLFSWPIIGHYRYFS
ncbi:MAG TPA: DUF1287 domain-containing protein [Pyrinomonadaceae bacterium]|nr:DUF1287 domain-containing protein [Pyrinomonadaceae bacterium]